MIIDGTDIRTLGMFILRGGSNDFLSFPERREPAQNNWAEHDGLDVDLSECTFEAKIVSVQLYISAAAETLFKQRLTALETMHFAAGYRTVLVKEFGKTFQLRFLGFSGYRHKGGLAKYGQKSGRLTVEYMMDDPVQYFTAPQPPKGGAVSASHVLLDGADLSGYGIIVKDIYSTSLQPRQAKPVLERTFRTINGITADTGAALTTTHKGRTAVASTSISMPGRASLGTGISVQAGNGSGGWWASPQYRRSACCHR